MQHLTSALLFLAASCAVPVRHAATAQDPTPPVTAQDRVAKAFAELVAADRWGDRAEARDRLIKFGEDALDVVIDGAKHESEKVRKMCHEILREHYPTDERSLPVFLDGLEDTPAVLHPSAFHFGRHRIDAGHNALVVLLQRKELDAGTRYAAAKSLGELGDARVTVMLWNGLGSDKGMTRYLAGLGMKGLAGKSLEDFGYEGPWEGGDVSGGCERIAQGRPIRKAQKRADRWRLVVRFTRWLQAERPELFRELEEKLW
ncbi:MAG: hypothetical protein GY711_01200 [bacterium]|nr:hypothetical protein [bacterium]